MKGVLLQEFLTPSFENSSIGVIASVGLYEKGVDIEFASSWRIPSAELVAVAKGIDLEGSTNLRKESGMSDRGCSPLKHRSGWQKKEQRGRRTCMVLAAVETLSCRR